MDGFIMENPMNKWMIWGVLTHYFLETPIFTMFFHQVLIHIPGRCENLNHRKAGSDQENGAAARDASKAAGLRGDHAIEIDWDTHRIHEKKYIYLHEWLIFMVNVGKYTIHGSYG